MADRPDAMRPTPTPPGFGSLARRLSGWTSRFLLSAVVLVAGLGFGRQVIRWWADDAPGAAASLQPPQTADGLGDPQRPHAVRFGDHAWNMRRVSIDGDKRAAADALRAACLELVGQGGPVPGLPEKTETDFLASLARRRPVEQQPGRWRLYELAEGLPMVVGTREGPAADVQRVATWGLALPAGPDQWTLYAFEAGDVGDETAADVPEIPFPPDGRRIVALRVAGGGAMATFAGRDGPPAWARFYDRWFAERGWRATAAWRQTGDVWLARFTAPGSPPAAAVDLRFSPDGRGGATGLLMIAPSS